MVFWPPLYEQIEAILPMQQRVNPSFVPLFLSSSFFFLNQPKVDPCCLPLYCATTGIPRPLFDLLDRPKLRLSYPKRRGGGGKRDLITFKRGQKVKKRRKSYHSALHIVPSYLKGVPFKFIRLIFCIKRQKNPIWPN